MKTPMSLLIMIVYLSSLPAHAEPKPFVEPILLTSCGQSADALMMKMLLTKDSLIFSYVPAATTADLAGRGSVLIVVGGSSKGLGAAKISSEEESARALALLNAAREADIPVLAIHLGGAARRGALSDAFIRLGAENAQHIIVVKGGNEDGMFTAIADPSKIPLEVAESALQVSSLVRALYRPQ